MQRVEPLKSEMSLHDVPKESEGNKSSASNGVDDSCRSNLSVTTTSQHAPLVHQEDNARCGNLQHAEEGTDREGEDLFLDAGCLMFEVRTRHTPTLSPNQIVSKARYPDCKQYYAADKFTHRTCSLVFLFTPGQLHSKAVARELQAGGP